MKKIFNIALIVMLSFCLYSSAFSQSLLIKKYVNYMKNANITQNDFSGMRLPQIGGTWFFVDGYEGNDDNNGLTPETAVLTLADAYGLCTSGRGDGIVIISRTSSTSSYTVRITTRLIWAKYGITMIGLSAPNSYFGRARISHTAAADSLVSLIRVTGQNNAFININFYNGPENDGDPVSATAQVSAVQVVGDRNAFVGCHFNCTPQSANAYKCDIDLAAGSEVTFDNCYFGSSSYDAGNNAACWVFVNGDGNSAERFFNDCTFVQQVSAGTAFGGIKSGGATTLNGVDIYRRCSFAIWRANTASAGLCASFFIGTKFNTGAIGMLDCLVLGFTALDDQAGNDIIYTNQPAGNGAGGIAITP